MVTFNYLTDKGKPRDVRKLKLFVPTIFEMEKTPLSSINYVFCTDDYLRKINREYLSHDYYTDIITFRLSNPREPVIADVYISTARVVENARLYASSYQEELRRVIFHGALHLCGYKDKTKAQETEMRRKENRYLNLF